MGVQGVPQPFYIRLTMLKQDEGLCIQHSISSAKLFPTLLAIHVPPR